jgi:arylsulfatase A-like enzyme
VLLFVSGACGPRLVEPPGRIVLISMDTVRADFVSGYGGQHTPELARIVSAGVRFTDAYAASSFTLPSHISMLTGLDVEEHGVVHRGKPLGEEVPTLAEALQRAGYRTQGFHEGGYMKPLYGFARGFESYRELPRSSAVGERLPEVIDWIREHSEEPYFLLLHTYAAHSPYGGFEAFRRAHPERALPPSAALLELDAGHQAASREMRELSPRQLGDLVLYNQLIESREQRAAAVPMRLPRQFEATPHFESDIQTIRSAYAERIRQVDRAIGEIRSALEELMQWDDTLFIVTSDHGEAFLEHGLSWHGYVPFDEVLRIPLLISFPRALGARAHSVQGLVWHLDLYPTILSLCGLLPGDVLGRDLRGVLLGEEEIPDDRAVFPYVVDVPLIATPPGRRVALRGEFKFIEGHERFGDAEGFLFDRIRDPGERQNLREARARDARELEQEVERYESRLQPRPNAPFRRPSRADVEALRDLGYVE